MMRNDFETYILEHVRPIDTQGSYERKLRATLAGLPQRRRMGVALRGGWRAAAVLAALCALGAGCVAAGLSRGVLNFNEDFGWGTPIVSQEGAQELVTSGALAHASLTHVDVDVLEAVYDGTELRVVYAVTSRAGEAIQREGEDLIVPGAADDGVHMCDYLKVNGQAAYFDDTYEAMGDGAGQVLYYLQTNLASWGVDVSGADELTVGLPLLPREEGSREQPTLDFVLSADVPEGAARGAALAGKTPGVRLTKASFSPVQGYVEVEIDDQTLAGRKASSFCRASAADGTPLACHLVLLEEGEDGLRAGLALMPPQGEWPQRIALALDMGASGEDVAFEIEIH